MPDWSYRPLFRPFLRLLSPERARDVVLRACGFLGRVPGGPGLLESVGGMRPSESSRTAVLGVEFASSVGLGAGLDTQLLATEAFAHFGFGFIEIGPVSGNHGEAPGSIHLHEGDIVYRRPIATIDAHVAAQRLKHIREHTCVFIARITLRENTSPADAITEYRAAIGALAEYVAFFTFETTAFASYQEGDCKTILTEIHAHANQHRKSAFVCIQPGADEAFRNAILAQADAIGYEGISVSGGVSRDTSVVFGPSTQAESLACIRAIRAAYGERFIIIGSGGIMQPADAEHFIDAGATLLQLHSGFVEAGPLLASRINTLLESRLLDHAQQSTQARKHSDWVGALLYGMGLCIAAGVIGYVALTSIVLPYDLQFCGVSRATIMAYNRHLLPFMSHDRLTLAGTLMSIGVLYLFLARFPLRDGYAWAKQAFFASVFAGIASFFLWLGFGYYDPVHAALVIGLIPFFVYACTASNPLILRRSLDTTNDRAWRNAVIGQLCFVTIGIGIIIGGTVIAMVGISNIFVLTDLAYLQTSAGDLHRLNPHLVPLIAHDRAGFGGALIAEGIALTIASLHGFKRGARWLWWAYVLSGLPGLIATIGIHLAIGYDTFVHLLPVYIAAVLFCAGLSLSFEFLFDNHKYLEPQESYQS